jgi:hypothetical protein
LIEPFLAKCGKVFVIWSSEKKRLCATFIYLLSQIQSSFGHLQTNNSTTNMINPLS